ncbi:Altered inheritance of mitochondria protein 18 mitochondrial [Orbilia brochopaga]|uniref:Altered inheritance of mitochondria protein 18 mitochondrial n=1 Tax=Orbilia brochopaga TaxID=3140254 RepID=A0AAV9U460_9PEZI
MASTLRCLRLQQRQLLYRRPPNSRITPLALHTHLRQSSSTASDKPPPKYPPIKPDPYLIQLREEARRSKPRPKIDRRYQLHNHEPYEAKSRRVNRQIGISLALFVGIIVVTQIWVPRDPKFQPPGAPPPPSTSRVQNDAKPIAEEDREVLAKAGGAAGPVIIKEATSTGSQVVETVPSGSSHVGPLPKRIYLPAGLVGEGEKQILEEYTLIGHGLRTVSFLSIQVYVVALYVATSSLPSLQRHLLTTSSVPPTATTATLPERESLKSTLLSSDGSTAFFNTLLDARGPDGVRMALRIVPTRSTDYPHLRDGWVRGIQGKTALQPTLYDDDAFVDALARFKAIFGGRKGVPKGRALILVRDEAGALFAYGPDEGVKEGKVGKLAEGARKERAMEGLRMLGVMDDPRVARALWLCYFAGEKVASEGARKSVVDGLVEVVARPVGSTEGKVV